MLRKANPGRSETKIHAVLPTLPHNGLGYVAERFRNGGTMFREVLLGVAVSIALSTGAFAQGTAAEAKAMLEKTVAAVKADKAKALDMIAKGEGGFLAGDLYPFCFNNTDGKVHPFPNPNAKALFGVDQRTIKDAAGKNYGQEVFDAAQKPEGQMSQVSYVFSKPGDSKPSPKISFVTRIGDLGCAVGYYVQ